MRPRLHVIWATLLERERSGNPVDTMWIIFDQKYRNSYALVPNCFRGCGFHRRGTTPVSPTCWTTSLNLGA